MRELTGLWLFINFVLAVIIFCVFIGIFVRLGKIRDTLLDMALHQGAIKDQRKWVKNKDGEWIRNPFETK